MLTKGKFHEMPPPICPGAAVLEVGTVPLASLKSVEQKDLDGLTPFATS
jgi:hypothetical protein